MQALDLDPTQAAQADMDVDVQSPSLVLARMIESCWRAGDLPGARKLCRHGVNLGIFNPTSPPNYPWLGLVYRKVSAAAYAQPTTF